MKIYFAGSIRGGRQDVDIYLRLIEYLKMFGCVLTEHVGDPTLSELGDDGPDDRFIHDRDMEWLHACDLMIAEVTMPSLGVGFEIGRAIENRKPVLCLYRPQDGKRLSALIAGSPDIVTAEYRGVEEAQKIVRQFLDQVHLI